MIKIMSETGPDIAKGPVARAWAAFFKPSVRHSVAALTLSGAVVGAVIIGGGVWALKATDRTDFCLSCHEMRAFVLPVHQQSPHFANRTGVRARCADCHVPEAWGPYLVSKARLAREIWRNWQGTIATQALYDAKRETLARRVWADMAADQSKACKTCHSHDAMARHEQSPEARAMMQWAQGQDGFSCISCHKGAAHPVPDAWAVKGAGR